MRALLTSLGLSEVAWFAARPVLIGLDFDGTLAPIVPRPAQAAMRRRTAQLLAAVCARYPVAVISGRHGADVRARLGDAPVRYVVGNHGADIVAASDARREAVAAVRQVLCQRLAGAAGIHVEDKVDSIAVHFRDAPGQARARARIMRAMHESPHPMRCFGGHAVVNVVPPGGPNKGEALRALVRRAGATAALFVGDDATDEDVFVRDRGDGDLLTIRVGNTPRSAARFYLRDQAAVDDLLGWLVAHRPTHRGRR